MAILLLCGGGVTFSGVFRATTASSGDEGALCCGEEGADTACGDVSRRTRSRRAHCRPQALHRVLRPRGPARRSGV